MRLKRSATAIFQDLVDSHGFAGGYNSVKRFVAKLRQKEPEQFDRLSALPGEEVQVDYGEAAPSLVPGSDRYRKPHLFVATLRYSRASFRCLVWKSSQQVWAELHERAFRHFGGCPQYVLLDNLKEGVHPILGMTGTNEQSRYQHHRSRQRNAAVYPSDDVAHIHPPSNTKLLRGSLWTLKSAGTSRLVSNV